jgi:hypothetical protein
MFLEHYEFICQESKLSLVSSVLGISDILVRIRIRTSEYGNGSGSDYFLQ